MKYFVNREAELTLIDDATEALLDKQRLLRTPIVEFYGVEGIGKTTLLLEVEERCRVKQLECLWAGPKGQTVDQCFSEARRVLEGKKPVVVILDALDTANKEQLQGIETGLHNLIEESKLFVVLASRKIERFDNIRSIARKLMPFPLQPLKRESCNTYFESIGIINLEIRDIIFDWTRGYPLAMQVMVKAIQQQQLDPREEQDKNQLISIIREEVIDKTLLARVSSSELPWYHKMLTLLSVPRRFNLVIMQDVIERFAREYKFDSSLEYITLPNRINQPGEVLIWNITRSGYSIDAPIRNLFLIKLKIEEIHRYREVHEFLAHLNERYAKEVTGSDRIHYLQEFFYHKANSGNVEDLPSILTHYVEQIIQEESFETFIQFSEEFSGDKELREALGDNANIVLTLIHRNFAKMYARLVPGASAIDRIRYLRDFFSQTARDPYTGDFAHIFEQDMQHIIEEVPGEVAVILLDQLLQDEEIKALLGQEYERIAGQLRSTLAQERTDGYVDSTDY